MYLFSLFLTLGIFSCKSHKNKTTDNDSAYIGEQVEVRGQKKRKHNETREKIVEESLTWVGTPYKYGHSEKGIATDCSGMVLVLYRDIAEIKLPRNSAQQADFCEKLKEKEIKPGDLVFFATGKDKKQISHVGVMIDGCKFVHASASKGVILSEMTTPYYQKAFIKYGRVPGMK
ncbi:MAG: C40 family peptidase [Muribaculaceae bacterium]|nr:C40 family peptidase [Muribaculaceae bacterium]